MCNVWKSYNLLASMGKFNSFSLFTVDVHSMFDFYVFQPKKEFLVWPVLLRAVFVPLFVFCNYMPKDTVRMMPIYITNDWVYWAIGITMGYTSGYLRYFKFLNWFNFNSIRLEKRKLINFFPSYLFDQQQFIGNDVCTTNGCSTACINGRYVCCCNAHFGHLPRYIIINCIPIHCEKCILVTYVPLCCNIQHTHKTIC